MRDRLIKFSNDVVSNIIFLALIAALISILGLQPNPSIYVFIIALLLILFLSFTLLANKLNQPFNKYLLNEKDTYPFLIKILKTYKYYENLRICGTSCTSIFYLFDDYVQAIAGGKSLTVCILNPEAEIIIEYLDDCEKDKEQVLSKVKKDIIGLEKKIDVTCLEMVKQLINSNNAYGKNLITASILVWFEAHRIADDLTEGQLTNGLKIFLYDHLPTLKCWMFGDNHLFIGGYGPMPGGVGINNPIHYIKRSKNNQNYNDMITNCKKTTNFLIDNDKTKTVSYEAFLKGVQNIESTQD